MDSLALPGASVTAFKGQRVRVRKKEVVNHFYVNVRYFGTRLFRRQIQWAWTDVIPTLKMAEQKGVGYGNAGPQKGKQYDGYKPALRRVTQNLVDPN